MQYFYDSVLKVLVREAFTENFIEQMSFQIYVY